jgi:hypothetical protein
MSLQEKVRKQLIHALEIVDEQGTRGARLVDDARRLWHRVQRLTKLHLVNEPDLTALEMACYALQLPMRQAKSLGTGRFARTNLRERAEQAAELLVSTLAEDVDENLLDRATRLLQETPHRQPVLEDARLLADALNLDDFGVVGLVVQMVQIALQGDGVTQFSDAAQAREKYGYWDARLKDGFHFEQVRQIARRRLAHARQVASMLAEEMKEDAP